MANLKFYKMAQAPVGTTEKPLEKGAIWFDSTNGLIHLFDGAKWDAYVGVRNASYAKDTEKLTITNRDGSTIEIDFSLYATDEALNLLAERVNSLESTVGTHGGNITDLQSRMTTVEGKVTTAEGKLAGLTGTVAEDIATAVRVEKERAEQAEQALGGRITTLETASSNYETRITDLEGLFTGAEGGSVQDLISTAIADNNTNVVTPGLDAKVDKTTYEAYVTANNTRVAAAEKEIDDEVIRATTAEEGLQEQIGSGFSKDATVAAAVKSAQDAATAAQETIDAFLQGEAIEGSTIDTLKEIQDWIKNDETGSAALISRVTTAEGEIDVLQSLVGVGEGAKTVDDRITAAKNELIDGASEGYATLGDLADKVKDLETTVDTEVSVATAIENAVYPVRTQASTNKQNIETLQSKVDVEKVSTAVSTAKQEAINAVVGDAETYQTLGALEDALNTLDNAAVKSVTGTSPYITVTGDKEAVVAAVTGSVASNDNKLAVASDVKTYVDAQVTNGLSWVTFE